MALKGHGAVAIWHDIVPDARDNFYAWHGQEHMPERVSIPGFLRGRRYISTSGCPEFFNLYETESSDITSGAPYLARLNNPTPWTLASVPAFRNVARSLCEVVASIGHTDGGLLCTFRYDVHSEQSECHRQFLVDELMPELARRPGVSGCHLLRADQAKSAVKTAEKNVRPQENAIPPWVMLLEGWGDERTLSQLCVQVSNDTGFCEAMVSRPTYGLYRNQASVTFDMIV